MATKLTTDWHIATKRVGGTTPESQGALCAYLRDSLAKQLDNNDHLICGDLLNEFTVPTHELVETYRILYGWLVKYGKRLALLRGNHDFSVRGMQMSSFDLLGTILKEQFPEQVTVATEVTAWKQFILVPHLPNNEILNLEVAKLASVRDKVIVFHANIDNFHAAETLHSLCLSMEQVEDLVSRGNLVVCGHEHQHRKLVNDRCVVLGNTVPSSIADCLGSPFKYAALVKGTDYELVQTWNADGNYAEVDWRDLSEVEGGDFVRVIGDAKAEEAAEVIGAISKFRQRWGGFVATNAVKVEGQQMVNDMASQSVEDIRAYDVLDAILQELDAREASVVRSLISQ